MWPALSESLKNPGLDNNNIRKIIPVTFDNLGNLEYLDLRSNELQHLNSDVFSGLGKRDYIFLDRNKMQYLHPDTFLWLPNIIHTDLSHNPRLQIPTDCNFFNSRSLSQLDISHCNVSWLSVETFTNLSALEQLNLRGKKLSTVDINILTAFPKLSALYLNGNPLQCDCQLLKVWRRCEKRNIVTGGVECETSGGVTVNWRW
jgi:Leucine-rich repeat (LRR) protein